MTAYRVHVRIELHNEDVGKVVLYDTQDHYFTASQGRAHAPFETVTDAVFNAMASLCEDEDDLG